MEMKVYLGEGVRRLLAAQKLIFTSTHSDGMLLGHRRGDLFFVENILSSPSGFSRTLRKYFSLSQILNHQILGFYSFRTNENKIKKLLCPLACGKIFLRLDLGENGQLDIKPFIIEYDKVFFLSPLELKSNP